MRNIVAGLVLLLCGLGFGVGIGLTWNQSQSVDVAQSSSLSKLKNNDSAMDIGSREVRNPLAVISEEPVTIEATEVSDAPLIHIGETEARIAILEQRVAELESAKESELEPESEIGPPGRGSLDQDGLQVAGFDETEVAEITDFFNRQQLQRLELRDKAIREGWIDSNEYRSALRELREDPQLRLSLGEDRYNQFLLSQGRSNRVKIDQVMQGSSAQISGVLPNDVISRYAETKIYTVRELQAATTAGDRDEWITLVINRSGEEIEFSVPRGPLGVTVSGVQVENE